MTMTGLLCSLRALVRQERGESGIGLLYIAPAIGMLILMALVAGRLGAAQTSLEAAVGVAVREATLAGTPGQAQSNAQSSARMTLDQADFTCGGQSLVMDTSALNNAPGVPGEVTATIQCSVPLADLAVPGLPGSWTLTAEAASPVDTYRERR